MNNGRYEMMMMVRDGFGGGNDSDNSIDSIVVAVKKKSTDSKCHYQKCMLDRILVCLLVG